MLQFLRNTYAKLKAHFIATVSTVGIGLLSLDIGGFADTVKNAADRFIPGGKAAQWVGIGLFGLTLARAVVFSIVSARKPPQ